MSASDITEFEPYTYYAVTAQDNNPDCVNYINGPDGKVWEVPEFYSNAGTNCSVTCGRCGQRMEILTAVRLDPQPDPA
ncbi:hypothetical protein [Streptomyces sp. NPDC006997]|uniref:hypothetical protein n=1 Tax=Streptomyces sp. NPDC006997 TaxID=3155356 RepID=UPI0033EEF4CD